MAKKNEDFSDTTILHFLGFFSFLVLPFSYAPGAMDPPYHLRFVLWSFLSLVLGLWIFSQKQVQALFVSMLYRRIYWVGGGGLLMATVSLVHCVNMAEGVFVWFGFFLAGGFFFICSQILYAYPNGVLILSYWALACGIGLVALGLMGQYWNLALSGSFFFKGIMMNKNLYASALFLFIPFVVHSLVSGHKIASRAAAIFLPVLCITILLSLSRAVWLALFFAAVPVALLAGERKKNVKNFIKKGILFALLLLSLFWICFFLPQSLKNSETVQLRLNLWSRTVQMIRNNLLLGVGPGQWRLMLPKYGHPLEINGSGGKVEIIAQRPHNDFLWVTAETGVLGGTCYLLFFGILYFYAIKVVARAGPGQKSLVLAMVYGISGYLIIALFSYPRERPLHSLLVMLMAAVVVSSYHRLYPVKIKGDRGGSMGLGGALKSIMVILLMACCLGSGLRLYSEVQLKKALQARARGEWHQVIAHIDRVFLSVYSIDPFGVPLPWYSGMAHYNNHDFPMAIKSFRQALGYHPHHDHSLNNLAVLSEMKK